MRFVSKYTVRAVVSAACFVACSQLVPWSGSALAQTFISQGPGPRIGLTPYVQSADDPPYGTGAGAVQAILPDPELGANTVFVGSPNGGIWVSNNFGASWTPLTDNQASLSIASLSLDPTDPTGKTIIAGIGLTSNGEWDQNNLPGAQGRGGFQSGLLYTTNGGATWSDIGANSAFAGESVVAADARGNTILAATYEVQVPGGATAGYGLFRSTNGGTTFSLVSGSDGLPTGAVTSLVADPSNPSTFYAAVKQAGVKNSTAVYISTNTGATWSPIFTGANSNGLISSSGDGTTITLAAGPNGSIAIAVSDLGRSGVKPFLAGVFLSGNQGTIWNQLTAAPNVVPGGQSPVNLHIAIDPTNGNIVYLTGDAYQNCSTTSCTVEAFRLNYNPSTNTSTATSLTNEGTAANNFTDANTAHADSRAIAFDASGNLILGSDGGIYLRTDPQGNGTWSGLNNNLTVLEPYVVAYDANSNRLAVAAQDSGVSIQTARNNPVFTVIQSGDGTNVAINDRTLPGMSAIYSTSENLGNLSRIIVNAQGQPVSPYDPVGAAGGTPIYCNGQGCDSFTGATADSAFSAPFVLNKVNPTLIAIGGVTDVYTTQDTLSGANGVNAQYINLNLTDLGTTAEPSVITYGTVNDNRAIAVGASTGQVWFSTNNTAGSLTQLTNYAGGTPTGIVFDTRIQSRLFVADASNLYYTTNAGGAATFTNETANLPTGFARPTSLEFISNNGVNAVLVGGLNAPLTCTSAPNGCVISPTQSPITVADSDSSGNLSGWRAFGQGLPNALVSTMEYNSTADVLSIGSVGRGVWVMYDVTSNFPQATVLQFGLADNNSNPSAALLTDGTVGSRPLIKYGTGTLTITGDATYSGSTTVNGGTLEVDGTISNTSNVTVNSGAALTGDGIVDPIVVTIASGATFAPGSAGVPGTSMTIVGNLAFQSGAFYLVQLNSSATTFATVTGTAALAGSVLADFAAGSNPQRQYTILQSAGLNGTTFSGVTTDASSNFAASLSYTNTNVLLNMTADLGAGVGLTGNQQNVANAINTFFNNGGALPASFYNLFNLSGGSLTTALSQLDGENATDAEKGAFQLMSDFLNLMLDPSSSASGGNDGGALGFAPEQDATLPPEVASAYSAMLTKAPPASSSASGFDQRWTSWGSAFGASGHFDGDASVGSTSVTAQDFGFAGGMDYHVVPNMTLGFGLAGAGTNWSLDQNLGTGRSDAFQAGVYAKTHSGPAYLSAALAFANHWFTTDRTAALGDQLQAKFDGQSYGGRLEAGYRYGLPVTGYIIGVTPYAAVQAQSLHTPSYGETDLTGGGFGITYNAMTATDTRSELGARADDLTMLGAMPLILRARLAWAHDWTTNPALDAAFQSLPGSAFIVNGAAPPKNSALTTAAAELRMTANWSLIGKFDGEFANSAQIYAGTGTLRYTW